ncbi:MAG: hypothetical protein L6R39_005360 [Caloplaca ligustica]|nr:MAG: hypothetical protein L6R39_005360 [Caloplaca ligustica]
MLVTVLRVLALSTGFANAFTDTSPLFMFSTAELLTTSPQIISASSLSASILPHLATCPSDTYVIVTQPGVHAEDYRDGYLAPHLRRKVQGEDKTIRSSVSVTDVLGVVDTEAIVREVEERCGAALLKVDASNAFLSSLLDLLPTSKYTVIYTTMPSSSTPGPSPDLESETYEMDTSFSSQTHMELKRANSPDKGEISHGKRANDTSGGNITLVDGALFERYAFLSPGEYLSPLNLR